MIKKIIILRIIINILFLILMCVMLYRLEFQPRKTRTLRRNRKEIITPLKK